MSEELFKKRASASKRHVGYIGDNDLSFLYVVGLDGTVKSVSAIPGGMPNPHGLKVGPSGAVYVADICVPLSGPKNIGLAKGQKARLVGTLHKFGPLGSLDGKYVARCHWGNWKMKDAMYTAARARIRLENEVWSFHGVSRVLSGGCVCGDSRFDLDGFERSFLPARHLCSVLVVDSNGNRVARIGRYGNADSRGPESLVPEPDIAYCNPAYVAVSDRYLYVHDGANRRILKAKLGYEAEEEVALP
jgi:hypothetical protein